MMAAEPEGQCSEQGSYWLVSFERCLPIRVYHLRLWPGRELRERDLIMDL